MQGHSGHGTANVLQAPAHRQAQRVLAPLGERTWVITACTPERKAGIRAHTQTFALSMSTTNAFVTSCDLAKVQRQLPSGMWWNSRSSTGRGSKCEHTMWS